MEALWRTGENSSPSGFPARITHTTVQAPARAIMGVRRKYEMVPHCRAELFPLWLRQLLKSLWYWGIKNYEGAYWNRCAQSSCWVVGEAAALVSNSGNKMPPKQDRHYHSTDGWYLNYSYFCFKYSLKALRGHCHKTGCNLTMLCQINDPTTPCS
jgi:hypothetical protein